LRSTRCQVSLSRNAFPSSSNSFGVEARNFRILLRVEIRPDHTYSSTLHWIKSRLLLHAAGFITLATSNIDYVEYPKISDFLGALNEKYPIRALVAYHNNFELLDYYYIDELAQMAEADLTGTDFRMTSGNAKFLLREACDEVRRLERAAKRAGN